MDHNLDTLDLCETGLKGHLLIATPSLDAGIFKSSVTYICEHNDSGAMGIIINRPSSLTFNEVLDEFDTPEASLLGASPILLGGPVGVQRGFVLHHGEGEQWESSLAIDSEIFLTGSKDILRALAIEQGPSDFLLTLGYAGWGAGQLEQEIRDNCWLTTPATDDILFNVPYEQRFSYALKQMGISESVLASSGGQA